MYTDVYVDVLFLINLSMDAVSLFLCARLCSKKVSVARILAAACIGAIYSVTVIFVELFMLFEAVIFISVTVLMTVIGIKPSGLTETLRISGVLFVCSALLGGMMSAIYSVITVYWSGYIERYSDDSRISPLAVIILAIISLIASLMLTRLHGTGRLPDFCDVELIIFKQKKRIRGVVDSGNLLTEPISGRAVIPVSPDCLRGIVSKEFLKGALSGEMNVNLIKNERERARFRLIPAKGISGEVCLYGIVPDSITLLYTRKHKTIKTERDAVLAVMTDDSCEFDCIIPSSII